MSTIPPPPTANSRPTDQIAKAADVPVSSRSHPEKRQRGILRRYWRSHHRIIVNRAVDTLLVLCVIGTLAASWLFIDKALNRYHIPTPMEEATVEQNKLRREYEQVLSQLESMKDAVAHASQQRNSRALLAAVNQKLADCRNNTQKLQAELEEQKNTVLALQHEIRQENKNSRAVAKGLLPGLSIGDVTTTNGKLYRNAVILRVQGKTLDLRLPDGQAKVQANQIVMDKMPDLFRFAFNALDLVDTSDFEASSEPKEKAPLRLLPRKQETPEARHTVNYEPEAGAPVVDTNANQTTTDTIGDESQPIDNSPWNAPQGELPMP